MDHSTKAKALAVSKMALGAGRIASSVALATGHGALGAYLKRHQMATAASILAKRGAEAGMAMLREGYADFKNAG